MGNENIFQIKYVSPGMVRCGINDFSLIYTENREEILFQVESFQTADNFGTKYIVKIPAYLKQSPEGRLIIKRIRNYINNDKLIQFLHSNITIGT